MKQNDLNFILQEGENYKIEFKESVDKNLVEEVCAFANASGGRIYIGISDDGIIIGTDTSNSARSKLQNSIRQIQPEIETQIETINNIVILEIPEGSDKPYGCAKGFFLRVGPNSQKLKRNEIISFIQTEGCIKFDELAKFEINYIENLNQKALSKYLNLAGISNVLPCEEVLINLDCLMKKDNNLYFTNAGILLFSNEPVKHIPQAIVICALYKGVTKNLVLDRKDLKSDLITVIDDAVIFLKKHLNLRYEIKSLRRKEILEIPEMAIREAVINAVSHRDYFEKGANVMIEIFDDRVEISNPGALPHGLPFKDFGKRSLSRNPQITSLLHRINYNEKMGTGINRMKEACVKEGIPEPEFDISGFFTIIFERVQNSKIKFIREDFGVNYGVNFGVNINETQIKILNCIQENSKISANKIAIELDLTTRAIEQNLSVLKKKNILTRKGPSKGGSWIISYRN